MGSLTPAAIEQIFREAHLDAVSSAAYAQMADYLEILTRWNARLNLTSVRLPAEILKRHFVECAFAAQRLPDDVLSLMDYGAGAGFPGMMIAICRPEIRITLAEAHGRKASFLREVIRSLELGAEVYPSRVEDMPLGRRFHAVSMRAVERMEQAIPTAVQHLERYLVLLTTGPLATTYRVLFPELVFEEDIPLPSSDQMVLAMAVPRGTTFNGFGVGVPRGTNL
jgi:16S rRNA (guanine527-N7)-methyltransferase